MIIGQILCAINLSDVTEQLCAVTMFGIVDVKSEYLTVFTRYRYNYNMSQNQVLYA
jgi:hypothetical protein